MKEELETVLEDIKDLQQRLKILRIREQSLKNKIGLPTHLIGKYLKKEYQNYYYYVKVNSLQRDTVNSKEIYAEGPVITVYKSNTVIQGSFVADSGLFILSDDLKDLKIISESEFINALMESVNRFKQHVLV